MSLGRAPVGATAMTSASACKAVDGELGTPAVTSIVEARRSWRVYRPLASVEGWLYAHPPVGLQLTTWTGAVADGARGLWGYNDQSNADRQSAQLGVGTASLGPSTTAICLESQVVWLDPRPWPDNLSDPRTHASRSLPAAPPPTPSWSASAIRELIWKELKARMLPPGDPTGGLGVHLQRL